MMLQEIEYIIVNKIRRGKLVCRLQRLSGVFS